MTQDHPLRPLIRQLLSELEDKLSGFEQTTHGCLGPFTIDAIGECLAAAYRTPSAYHISNLAQEISGFLKRESAEAKL